jgi:hypothetical protein
VMALSTIDGFTIEIHHRDKHGRLLERRSVRNVDHLDHLQGLRRRGSTWGRSA